MASEEEEYEYEPQQQARPQQFQQQPQQYQQQQRPAPQQQHRPPPQQQQHQEAASHAAPILQLGGATPQQEQPQKPKARKWTVQQLRASDAIIPLQYGTNRFASQRGMTGFGTPRDVRGAHLHRLTDDDPEMAQQQGQEGQ